MEGKLVSGNTMESADEEYKLYRQSGVALSVTIVTFSTALIAWTIKGHQDYSDFKSHLYWQVIWLLFAIFFAFLIQLFNYIGYQFQARRNYAGSIDEVKRMMRKANSFFGKADTAVVLSCIFLIAGLGFTFISWFKN